jgi:hypothetical protein
VQFAIIITCYIANCWLREVGFGKIVLCLMGKGAEMLPLSPRLTFHVFFNLFQEYKLSKTPLGTAIINSCFKF